MPKKTKRKHPAPTFGIGEWYGKNLASLTGEERAEYAKNATSKEKNPLQITCPFKSKGSLCSKLGGVCSLRRYEPHNDDTFLATPADPFVITCPTRFYEGHKIFKRAGEKLLGDSRPKLVAEVGFLEPERKEYLKKFEGNARKSDVGRIDMVLASVPGMEGLPLAWAALEIQAVYFSGDSMGKEFSAYKESPHKVLFPVGRRRPDFRSSGPKRLMPQLQTKVPTLRRWGKKMAVVVDRPFFDSIGTMDNVQDLSNADIAWIIVEVRENDGGKTSLELDEIRFTTLERSIEGLTGGVPVAQEVFEERIRKKLGLK